MKSGRTVKLNWILGVTAFFVLLLGTWVLLREKFNVDKLPESYGFVAKFEVEGVPPFSGTAVGWSPSEKEPRLEGAPFQLDQVKEPIVIVNFWASWCNPCVQEFPSMVNLIGQMKGKVAIVAVSMDDDEKDLMTFAKLFKVPQPGFYVVWDKDKSIGAKYGVGKLPESYLVGPDRKLVRKVLGIEDWASPGAISYFESLLAKKN